jgi:hypothetical protein
MVRKIHPLVVQKAQKTADAAFHFATFCGRSDSRKSAKSAVGFFWNAQPLKLARRAG